MNKVISRECAGKLVAELRNNGNEVVFTNGCFDILHAGHVRYLNAAGKCGDILVVGLNTDSSVKSFKGDLRPVNGEEDRAEVLSALEAVDYIVFFHERTASELIKIIRPDVYVKGGDYAGTEFEEKTLIEEMGGRVEFLALVPGRSTTNTIARMQQISAQQQ